MTPTAGDSQRGAEPAEPQWISHLEAARMIGCHHSTVVKMARAGRLATRRAPRRYPSVDRQSAIAVASETRAARTAARNRPAPDRTATYGQPPPTPADWIDVPTAAGMLNIGASAVLTRIRFNKLPSTLHGGRRWMRRPDVEIAANVKAF